ncbi:PPE family protein, SVP subgroup [Mycobacterium sp.]|uniref:PPE family protein, SVP subgroup n=1 Tax=Mycobacterium sp. TaxID=1785 RepID=UPI003F96FCC5
MDFGIYPPEINSGRMYAGPGSGPMMAAAQAWGSLADELYTAAGGYQSVVSELTSGAWSGPSSAAMGAAAGAYVEWLSATAAQAEETAAQARAAAAGYEAAFAMTVPPPEIAANRGLLAVLVATNFLGINTPAIAATEAQYAEMWAQDAVAMYGYAGSSAAATALTPFTSPHQNTDPGGTASQAAAVSQATGTSAGNAQSIVSNVPQTLSAVPDALQSLSTSAQSTSLSDFLDALSNLINIFASVPSSLSSIPDVGLGLLATVDLPYGIGGYLAGYNTDELISGWNGEVGWPDTGPAPLQNFPPPLTNLPPGTVPVSAGLGQANTIGGLSVPANWTVAAPEIRSIAKVSPITNAGPAAAPLEDSANTFNQMGLAGMSGQAMAGPPAAGDSQETGKPVTHARLTARGPGAASDGEAEATPAPRTVVTGVAAAVREIAKHRDEGRLTEEEYNEQKKRLLEISVRHRPFG